MSVFLRQHLAHMITLGGPFVVLLGMAGTLRLTDPHRRRAARPAPGVHVLLAVAWCASAGIHLAVTPEHFAEGTALGVFFLALSLAQLSYAALLARRPSPSLLLSGVAGNVAVVTLWAYSRLVAVPFGLGDREPVGLLDAAATALEVAAVVVALVLLADRRLRGRSVPPGPLAAV